VQGVGPGTILGGRYFLRRRLTQGRDVERWSAHDTTLARTIALTIVDVEHPNRAGVLDAARRAAGVEDARLVRILDVGTQDGNSYFVEEEMEDALSLTTILLRGPLPAEEARRIVGEVASGLETARQRGLHHLRLTPNVVMRTADGAIRISGVAVAAAIDDAQEPDPAAASRLDAVGVVALAYAALTSRWPLDERVPGIEPAPRVVGGVPAPSEIATGVPADLDALCRMTLNEDTGPLDPGDFSRQIAPWSRDQVHRVEVEPTIALATPDLATRKIPTPDPARPDPAARELPTPELATPGRATPGRATPDATKAGVAGLGTSSGAPEAVAHAESSATDAAPTAGERVVAAGSAATKAVDSVVAEAGAAAAVVVSKVGSLARAAADIATTASIGGAEGGGAGDASESGGSDGAGRPSDTDVDYGRMTLREALSGGTEDAEPPLPLLPGWSTQAPSRDQAKLVVMIVAGFVALALVIAYFGTRGLGGSISLPGPTPRNTHAAAAPSVTAAPTEEPTGPAAGAPIAILSATGFDPQGDGQENNLQAARVYDGNLATAWSSEGYGSVNFGGLGKKGLGVRLDLGQPTSVNQVIIDLGLGPVDLTVYAATKDSLDGATIIGAATDATGRVEIKAAAPMPKTQYVIVWFTKLAPDGGKFRASISEIALS
jgi:eukaryotic-like serine/threonine-protein kinase